MIELNAHEARVLGVLFEKDKTTPEQYPLSLNAIVNGANQKNNREPITSIAENDAFDALESLRGKGLVVRTDTPGQRVNKYRHHFPETLRLRAAEAALLAELLLRGPQTLGELRGRATRMHPMESTDAVKELLRNLIEREEPLVSLLSPSPGSRAERYAQLLCREILPADSTAPTAAAHAPSSDLAARVAALEEDVTALKLEIQRLSGADASSAG